MKNKSLALKISLALLLVLGVLAGAEYLVMPQAPKHNALCDSVPQILPGKVAHIHPIPSGVQSALLCKYDGLTKADYKISSLAIPQPAKLAHLINRSPVAKEVVFCTVLSSVNYQVLFTLKSGDEVPFEFGRCGPASSPYSSNYFDLAKAATAKLSQLEKRLAN
jgi:hypothetical protein